MRHPVVPIETPRLTTGVNEVAEILQEERVIPDVTDASFEKEVLKSNQSVLVDFWAPGCPPCLMLSPILGKITLEARNVKFVKVNAASERKTAGKYRIQAVPTLMVFRNGEPGMQMIGFKTEAELREILAEIEKNDLSSSYCI